MEELESKVDKILTSVQDIKVEIAKSIVHQEQHRKEIDIITKKVNKHENNQNKFFGVLSLIGLGVSAFFSWLFRHF